jgi:hypothetical protein
MQLTPELLATDDFEIFECDRRVGCIYKITFRTSVRWRWQIYAQGGDEGQVGKSDTMSEAVAAFCAAFDARLK